ncbi:MAG TPA: lysylphosphatidylglycerol synthase transmembrane domain-containing protein [archaeon]|nr:lysylphosphatidylglycerol synthase transmembrane domain-containing protein [archaeon]
MKKFFSSLFKIAVTLLLLYWVFSEHGVRNIGSLVRGARLDFILLAAAIFTASNFLGALQWQRLLEGQGINFPYRRSLNLYFIGLFFNTILPSSLGGDVVKIYSISRVEKKGREGLAATFVDRFAGFFLLSLFAIFFSTYLIFSPIISGDTVKHDIIVYISTIFLVFIAATAVLFSRRVGRLIYEVLLARVELLGLKNKFREMHGFLHIYRDKYRLAVEVFFLSLGIQLARIAVHYYLALSIGFDISFIYFLIFVPLIAMAAVIPISFGGLGVRESTAPFLFTSVAAVAAVDPGGSLAVTTQLLASLVGIFVGLAGGVLFIFSRTAGKLDKSAQTSTAHATKIRNETG